MPLMSNEMGTYSASGTDLTSVLGEAVALGVNPIIWFVPDGGTRAIGLINADLTLRPSGYAYKTYVNAGGLPVRPSIAGSNLYISPTACAGS